MSETDITAPDAMAIGSRLAGARVASAQPARSGGNNRVFRLEMANGPPLALKHYPSDGRDRLGQEYDALSFLARHGITSTPQPVAKDAHAFCALYQWFDGEAAVLRPQDDDADQLADFLIELQKLRDAEGAQNLRNASASIFSPEAAITQYEQRLDALRRASDDHPDLRAFIEGSLVPSTAVAIRQLRRRYAELGRDPTADLAPTHRALSPSDFGLHNALRAEDGRLRFIDFEYFGWDDPVKLVSDTAIHPGSDLPEASANRLIERLSRAFEASDDAFAIRRDVLYPVFKGIWCLIVLNAYLPDSRSRRAMAAQGGDVTIRLAGQLDKARRLHQTIRLTDLPK
ncbi:aminoglycoside phosphotransferase family protein [Bradyrhizobium sp. 193]|uniref:aminoglycoside phosphotransferase family protein n=2 Tax=unclassified Bradyrhizobium TaxID=2631580 RepID=UPI001FF9C552|nr:MULTISPECIES: aminoglycoside phosphotransferase family protein [unclassified Bradyrhizobium]MCK1412159.1 aminoglycoside phosphotransferase family protein [Bradyrhizobium sp. CW4]MCK1486318.1 aminoglycoside phosphotransferase family protein [Bradyrhizobium sp. 193]MCK1581135.1 aminoglycoside phosphotransferase family protein [Bradyrhizobium sp. 168]UPK14363.1 aminoglycoside phosphotransferase family protein [Bradyrhizobium sp. 155]UPK16693.1 aminoglycoside phosphotransferase family protein [